MILIKVITLLCVVALMPLTTQGLPAQQTDLQKATQLINCLRKIMITGSKDLDIPTFSPLNQTFDVNIPVISLGSISFHFGISKVNWTGIPNFTYELNQTSLTSKELREFNFRLQWPKILFLGIWTGDLTGFGHDQHKSGDMTMLLENVIWTGSITLSAKAVVALNIKPYADKATVGVTNMGPIAYIFDPVFDVIWTHIFNSPIAGYVASHYLGARITEDWLQDPPRITKLFGLCTK